MAFERVRLDNQIYNKFMFFSEGGVNGLLAESVTGGDEGEVEHYYIREVRLHVEPALSIVTDFIVKLSDAIQGSAFNQIFLSQAMNTADNLQWFPNAGDEKGILFNSGDKLGFLMSMTSGVYTFGLVVLGWAVAS